MKLRQHIVPTLHFKCYFMKNPQFKTFCKIKYLNNFCNYRKNDDVFWSTCKLRSWPDNKRQPFSDPGINISIQRAFFWCVGCINKLWMGCWQLTFIWARPKIKAKKRPSFSLSQISAKNPILYNCFKSGWTTQNPISYVVNELFKPCLAFIGLSKASDHSLSNAVRGTPKCTFCTVINWLIN